MIKIAINGFGRIGRNILRALHENKKYIDQIEVVVINDLAPIEHAVHLLKYDSVHSRFDRTVNFNDNEIIIENKTIKYYSIKTVENLPWKELDIDIVLDCTGKYTTKEKALGHVSSGAKKVLISAPCENADKTIVYGVNDNTLSKQDIIISNASCTTNCLAPIIAILNSEYGLENGIMTTIHSYTGDQKLIDTDHSDLYRARAANISMIPSKTGAAKAIGLIIPELNGKINGMSVRIPTPNVSLVDFNCILKKYVTVEEINKLFKRKINENIFKGILDYNEEHLVSIDFNHNSHSSIFDSTQTMVSGKLLKVMAWYDNEWGFSNRMLDMVISINNLR